MTLTPEFMLHTLLALASAGGMYAAIRADLARLYERVEAQRVRLADLQAQINRGVC